LSTRADLVSGGDVLVEVKLPPIGAASSLKVDVDGVDVTSAFTTRSDGRTVGLVTGLKNGANNITASSTNGGFNSARIVVTNHPKGGPILLGSQSSPWICATPVPTAATASSPATNASGLTTAATDAQCTIATETKFFYRTLTPVTVTAGDGGCSFVVPDPSPTIANPNPTTPANSCLQPYVVGTTPAASVASTTTTNGVTVPYIVRVERGTINRGIYDIAVLFDPAKPWTANSPQPQWNGKLSYTYGASAGQPRLQFRSEQNWVVNGITGVFDDSALRMGFIVADNSQTDQLYNANAVLVAETTMMMKEYIAERYGEIKYTVGNGCSGGSILQNQTASIYPGLLDGIQVECDYPDAVTTLLEVADCVLLVNAYQTPEWLALQTGLTQAQINAKKAAINGHLDQVGCQSWNNSFGFINKPGNYVPLLVVDQSTGALAPTGAPRNNCLLPASQVYDPVTNPNGTRCGQPDLAVAVWGTTAGIPAGSTRAVQPFDNVGIQYGLKALLAGTISPEEFVTLNEKMGGIDGDANRMAARSVADAPALDIAYRSGIISSGKNLGKVAIIDWRGYDEQGIHYIWRSFSERARLDASNGDHNNQVMWRFGTGLTPPLASGIMQNSLTVMDVALQPRCDRAEGVPQRRAQPRPGRRREARHGVRLLLPDERHDVLEQGHQLRDVRHRPEAEGQHVAAPGRRRPDRREHHEVPAEAARLHRLHRHHLHRRAAGAPQHAVPERCLRLVQARRQPAGSDVAADVRGRPGRRFAAAGPDLGPALIVDRRTNEGPALRGLFSLAAAARDQPR